MAKWISVITLQQVTKLVHNISFMGSCITTKTSIPWAVKLSGFKIIYSHSLFQRAIVTRKVGQTNLVFGARQRSISRPVHARLQVSACSSYNL